MIVKCKSTDNSDYLSNYRLLYTFINVYSVLNPAGFCRNRKTGTFRAHARVADKSAVSRHLNASPFTLQTDASFLRMSDTTSLCKSNLSFNLNMGIQSSPSFTSVKLCVVELRQRSSTCQPLSLKASCDRKFTRVAFWYLK